MAEQPEEGSWALLNLIGAILTAVGAGLALARRKEDEEDSDNTPDDDDDGSARKLRLAKAGGIAAAAASIIAFILTEDMSLPMAMADKWTILTAVLLAAQIGTAVAAKKASEKNEPDDGEY